MLSRSMWYVESEASVRSVVTVYDNHGAVKHHRDQVILTVREVGQGEGGFYRLIDGRQKTLHMQNNIISSYPNDFVNHSKVLINKHDVDPDAPYTIFTASTIELTNPGTSRPYTRLESSVYIYWDDSDLPEAPGNIGFLYDPASQHMVLSGVDSTMEYRLKSQTPNDWKPCTNEPMYFDCESTPVAYYVRYAATDGNSHSQTKEVILPAQKAVPGAVYDQTTETITGLDDRMEIQIDDGPYEATPGASMNVSDIIDHIPNGSTATINVRYRATASVQAGAKRTFTLYPRAEAPSTLAFDPATISLTGCTTKMQYRGEDDSAWKSVSGTTLKLESYARPDRDSKVLVRFKPTTSASASLPVEFTIPKLLAGPSGQIDYVNEVITGLENGNYQYGTTGTSWTSLTISDGQWNIAKLISSSPKTLYLRKAATATEPVTAATLFELPGKLATPTTPVFIYNDDAHPGQAVLSGVNAGMQYRKSADASWTDIPNEQDIIFDLPTSATTYYIRNKATDHAFASSNKSLTLASPGAAPLCSYSRTTEMITSLTTKMEMKIGNGAYTPVSETKFSTTELIDSLPSGASIAITVRTQATATAPASKEKEFALYARSSQPTGLTYNSATNTISGCSTAMEYRLDSASSWTAISSKTLNLQNYASTERDIQVYIRMKATTTAAASLPVEFTIPRKLSGPEGVIEYSSESIVGLPNGAYQYSTDKAAWKSVTITNGRWDISTLISTSSRTLYLRKAATGTEPVSDYTAFKISARPTAPKTPVFVYNDLAGRAILDGVTLDMQYRKSTDTVWTDVNNEAGIIFSIPAASETYYVRTRANDQSFASANKSLTLVKQGAAPGCTYSSKTETITSLTTKMEMKIGTDIYRPVEATSFSTTDLIDHLYTGTLTISVRTQATATAPASKEKVFTLYPRLSPPTTVTYLANTISLSGCSSAMEYRLDAASTWTSISGKTVSLKKAVSADRDVLVYVRMKATTTASASLPVEFVIPRGATAAALSDELDMMNLTDKPTLDDPAQTETPIESEQPEQAESQDKADEADLPVKDELEDDEAPTGEENTEPSLEDSEETAESDENSGNSETPVLEE